MATVGPGAVALTAVGLRGERLGGVLVPSMLTANSLGAGGVFVPEPMHHSYGRL